MPSKKIKAKGRGSNTLAEKAHAEPCSCHTYEFGKECLSEATAAKIASAFPEISFDVNVSHAGRVGVHLDGTKFRYSFATPDFRPTVFAENPIRSMFMGVWQDMQQIADNLVDLLFAATYADEAWLDSAEGKQVAASFIAMQLALYRCGARFEELKKSDRD